MARIDTSDMPDRLDFSLNDLLKVQTNLFVSLLSVLEVKGVLTRAEFGKHLLSREDRSLTEPSEHIIEVLARTLASIDPDPPTLTVVD